MRVWKLALWLDPFFQRIQIFRWNSTEELRLMTLKSDTKFEETWILVPKMIWGIRWILNADSGKSENLHIYVLLLPVLYNVSADKVQKNDLPWHWKKIQTLKKNWLFIWKMSWGIWWTLTGVVKSLKIFTLMDNF